MDSLRQGNGLPRICGRNKNAMRKSALAARRSWRRKSRLDQLIKFPAVRSAVLMFRSVVMIAAGAGGLLDRLTSIKARRSITM
jgi:hypothetical protein